MLWNLLSHCRGGGSSFFEPSMGTNSPHASPYATEGHCCGTLEEGSTTREGLVSIFSQGWAVILATLHTTPSRRYTLICNISVPILLLLQDLCESQIFTVTSIGRFLLHPTFWLFHVPRISAKVANAQSWRLLCHILLWGLIQVALSPTCVYSKRFTCLLPPFLPCGINHVWVAGLSNFPHSSNSESSPCPWREEPKGGFGGYHSFVYLRLKLRKPGPVFGSLSLWFPFYWISFC